MSLRFSNYLGPRIYARALNYGLHCKCDRHLTRATEGSRILKFPANMSRTKFVS